MCFRGKPRQCRHEGWLGHPIVTRASFVDLERVPSNSMVLDVYEAAAILCSSIPSYPAILSRESVATASEYPCVSRRRAYAPRKFRVPDTKLPSERSGATTMIPTDDRSSW